MKDFIKYEIPDILLESIPTKPIGQHRKIRKPHSGCNSIWMHYEHKVQICTFFTDAFVEKWEVVADIKSKKAVKQKSKLTIFCCMMKFDRKFISLWDGGQTSDMELNEQAEAEPDQAQP